MKKRQFLSPLALLASLLTANVANAGLPQMPSEPQANHSQQASAFILKPANAVQVADEDSPNHASHSSHSSHSSHYSSR